jgi:CCR4-NOT transcription complex subunit 1
LQKIYGGQLAIPAVVDMLASFRDSGNDKEQQIFSCMVHNLFDEYQFFTKYPDKVRTVNMAAEHQGLHIHLAVIPPLGHP